MLNCASLQAGNKPWGSLINATPSLGSRGRILMTLPLYHVLQPGQPAVLTCDMWVRGGHAALWEDSADSPIVVQGGTPTQKSGEEALFCSQIECMCAEGRELKDPHRGNCSK